MTSRNLNSLSKNELIQIIENLEKKYSLCNDEILPAQIDYRSLLEATSDIIYVVDKKGNLVYINSAWKAYFPSMVEENLGGHYSKNIPAIEKERADYVFVEVVTKGNSFENEMMKTYNESGEPVYFTASISPIKTDNGEIVGCIGIMKNITERHIIGKQLKEKSRILEDKVKEQLAQSEELKELRDFSEEIVNIAPIGIFVMDPSGIILSENPAFKEIMGHGPGDSLVGENLLNYAGFSESDFGMLYKRSVAEKKMGKAFNIPYRSKYKGKDLIIDAIVVPIIDNKGSVEKVILMVEDNTRQAEITKRAQHAEKLSALGLLASGVASELRNHINKMVMDINFISNNVGTDSTIAGYVDSLQHELGRIKNISEQLVSLSSADDEQKDICEINKILSSHTIDVMITRLKKEGYTITVTPSDENPTVKANLNQLQQILIEFLENSMEAMPQKGDISVTIDTVFAQDGKFAVLEVADSGIGIAEENFSKIFDPFFTTKGKDATGLGLMITSAIVQNLGGTIGLKSSPGEGTTIRVALPIAGK